MLWITSSVQKQLWFKLQKWRLVRRLCMCFPLVRYVSYRVSISARKTRTIFELQIWNKKGVTRQSLTPSKECKTTHTHTCVCTYICINPVLYHKEKVNILSLSVPRNKLGGFSFVLLSFFVFQQRFPTSISNQWAAPNGLKDSLVLCQQVFYSVPEWRLL